MNPLNDLTCIPTCDPSLQRLHYYDLIVLKSQDDAAAIFTHVCSHASEMLPRVKLAAV